MYNGLKVENNKNLQKQLCYMVVWVHKQTNCYLVWGHLAEM